MTFYKYQGTGNDFIIFDNREGHVHLTAAHIAKLCNRHMGIGADGLMLLEKADGYDFKMVYYNSDGKESTMCGNGGRCMVAFAKNLGIINVTAKFIAIDGPHTATIEPGDLVSLRMQDVSAIDNHNGYTILNTGSPHYVQLVPNVQSVDVFAQGRKIRSQSAFQPDGINVNFVQMHDGKLVVRTYERGVEDETLSCGTGVTAAAIAATAMFEGEFSTDIETPGGNLQVNFTKNSPTTATDVYLIGPATFVFRGEVNV